MIRKFERGRAGKKNRPWVAVFGKLNGSDSMILDMDIFRFVVCIDSNHGSRL